MPTNPTTAELIAELWDVVSTAEAERSPGVRVGVVGLRALLSRLASVEALERRVARSEALVEKWRLRSKGSSSCLRGQGGQYELEQCIRELTLALRPAREEQPGDGDGV